MKNFDIGNVIGLLINVSLNTDIAIDCVDGKDNASAKVALLEIKSQIKEFCNKENDVFNEIDKLGR